MFVAKTTADNKWESGRLEPYGDIAISPAACVLNYGQGIFEGLKAYHSHNNKILLFRPDANANRIADGCRRICIPPVPKDLFMQGVTAVIKANQEFIPPYRPNAESQGALYLRPLVLGTGPILGVNPAPSYTFLIYASPVGPYFKGGLQPIKLVVSEEYHRATPGGTGCVKFIGNYAASLLPKKMAKSGKFDEVVYLDSVENKYVEETGAANFFCIKGNNLTTPKLDGTILPGITRNSVLQLAKDRLKLNVKECKLDIEDALRSDEAFATGTAAVISPIGCITFHNQDHLINNNQIGSITRKLYKLLVDIQHGLEQEPYGWVQEIA